MVEIFRKDTTNNAQFRYGINFLSQRLKPFGRDSRLGAQHESATHRETPKKRKGRPRGNRERPEERNGERRMSVSR